MTSRAQQQAAVDKATRMRIRDYHRALDEASRDAEGIAELTPTQDTHKAATRLMGSATEVHQAVANGDHQAAHAHAIELAGDALALAATLTLKDH